MKTYLLLILIFSLFTTGATDFLDLPDNGLAKWRPAPHKGTHIEFDADWIILPKTDIYEVIASQSGTSLLRDLPESCFKELTESNAKWLTGHYYSCPAGKRPVLIKGVYPREGAGRFRVERRGKSLSVIWGNVLGASHRDLQHSALIVNLDFTPDEIYNDLSSIPTMP